MNPDLVYLLVLRLRFAPIRLVPLVLDGNHTIIVVLTLVINEIHRLALQEAQGLERMDDLVLSRAVNDLGLFHGSQGKYVDALLG